MRILMATVLLLLTACTASMSSTDRSKEAPQVTVKNTLPSTDQKVSDSTSMVVDYSCKQDSDCAIKDVGSCCGASPACVNKDSETFPKAVQAQCQKEGMMSTCGFASISSCTCTNNRCTGVSGPMAEEKVQ